MFAYDGTVREAVRVRAWRQGGLGRAGVITEAGSYLRRIYSCITQLKATLSGSSTF